MLGVRKAVITAAGLGTRLLPVTKEIPKEMLPLFVRGTGGEILLKPLMQVIFEQLYGVGVREFYVVVGRGKRAIEDHFTPDPGFLQLLRERGKSEYADELEKFYAMVRESSLVFLNQPEPRGFGDAVLRARGLVRETFVVHAGDTYIHSQDILHLRRLLEVHREMRASATLLVMEVDDPRPYGIVGGRLVGDGVWEVERLEEKPEKPWSRLAILPVYAFEPLIFKALEETPPGKGGEVQLTDAVAKLLEMGGGVLAVRLPGGAPRLDVGYPEGIWEALRISYSLARGGSSF